MDDKDNYILSGSGTDSIAVTDTITLDLDMGAVGAALELDGVQTITLDDLNMTSSTITLPSSTYTISGGGGGVYTTNGTSGYTLTQNYAAPTVNIDTDGVNIKEGGDLKIGNVSLKDFISKMEQRLAILVPDPEKLEKFEALKKAYEHYKTMESLCFPDEKEEKDEC
jgi:hypothetical protein